MLNLTNISITNNYVGDLQVIFDGLFYFRIHNHKLVILNNITLYRETKYYNINNEIIYPLFAIIITFYKDLKIFNFFTVPNPFCLNSIQLFDLYENNNTLLN